MSRTFHFFHLSLIERTYVSLFADDLQSREDNLRHVLSDNFQFSHRNKSFSWVAKDESRDYIIGMIQRKIDHTHHRPPEEGGDEITEPDWQGAIVIIDPRTHDSGQVVLFEEDRRLGKSGAILTSMFKHINAQASIKYLIHCKPIFDGQTFWSFAEAHGNKVQRISFKFIVPNMWGTTSALEKELRDTAKTTGADSVDVTFHGSDGVSTDTDRVSQGVEYSERGGGSITARAKSGETYSSIGKTKSEKVEEEDVAGENLVEKLHGLARKMLGNE